MPSDTSQRAPYDPATPPDRRPEFIDPRSPRFGAALTSLVLVAVLLTGSGWLLLAQAVVFAAAAYDLALSPYGWLYRRLVRRRLAPPSELEAAAPPRFAQLVGLVFAAAGTAGYLFGVTGLGVVATALALVAAFLNAAFAFCLGCELHLLIVRALHRPTGPRFVPARGN